jgi:probable HAF family extracellular repeat protein
VGGVDAVARAINNLDQIVGWIVFDDGITRESVGALWTLNQDGVPGNPITLGDLFLPKDISDTGLMAGYLENQGDPSEAAIAWFQGGVLNTQGLGVLPDHPDHVTSFANAISANGEWVVGTSSGPTDNEAFLWSEATGMIGLGQLDGVSTQAHGVNNAGQVVGTSNGQEAFLWENGQMFDLNTLDDAGRPSKIRLGVASDVNNAGHIVGEMVFGHPIDELHGFLLIPDGQ